MSVHEYARRERARERSWKVTLAHGRAARIVVRIQAPTATQAARRAQKLTPGATALVVEAA